MKITPPLIIAAGLGVILGAISIILLQDDAPGDAQTGQVAARGGPGGGSGGRGGYTPVVSMGLSQDATVSRGVEVIGRARALKSVAITSEVTGLVESVNIAPGLRVQKGDLLLQIVDDEQQVALKRARAEFPIARDNAERYKDLESDAAASELESEQAQTNFVAIQAQLRAAEVAVAQRRIIAPFDGIAGLTDIEVGDYLRAGDMVTTLDDTSSIIIEFSVPQESSGFINIGQDVSVSLTSAGALKYKGKITAIDSRIDSQSRSLRVEAVVENQQGRLIPGAVLTVSTKADGERAISVPGLSVQWDRSGAYVWRRNAEGVAERAGVVILQRTDNMVLVEGELKADEPIVIEGADRVRAGVPLPEAVGPGGAALGISASSL